MLPYIDLPVFGELRATSPVGYESAWKAFDHCPLHFVFVEDVQFVFKLVYLRLILG